MSSVLRALLQNIVLGTMQGARGLLTWLTHFQPSQQTKQWYLDSDKQLMSPQSHIISNGSPNIIAAYVFFKNYLFSSEKHGNRGERQRKGWRERHLPLAGSLPKWPQAIWSQKFLLGLPHRSRGTSNGAIFYSLPGPLAGQWCNRQAAGTQTLKPLPKWNGSATRGD